MTTEQLIKALQEALGPGLNSVVLYGSAAAGDFVEGVSGRDLLIVAERLGATELAALSAPLAEWERAGNPLPQLFMPQELVASADVFPIELIDMQQSRRVLFGPDPLAEIQIDTQHFRTQLEHEFKTRLLLLRRKYLACCGKTDRVTQLMVHSVSSFLVLMRAALRLYNEPVPAEKAQALEELHRHMIFDTLPFSAILELKTRKQPFPPGEVESLFSRYLASIQQVVEAVDQHLHKPSA
jgi:hypothetical protein